MCCQSAGGINSQLKELFPLSFDLCSFCFKFPQNVELTEAGVTRDDWLTPDHAWGRGDKGRLIDPRPRQRLGSFLSRFSQRRTKSPWPHKITLICSSDFGSENGPLWQYLLIPMSVKMKITFAMDYVNYTIPKAEVTTWLPTESFQTL